MRMMSISVEQLLKKMESELHKAKLAESTVELREHVHSIKILCELILDDQGNRTVQNLPEVLALQPQIQTIKPTTLSVKKLEEEEANGDSLFDF
jgi:hypothetical protein